MLSHPKKIKAQFKQYTLKYSIDEDPNPSIYTTDDSDVVCVLRPLTTPKLRQSYEKQKQILSDLRHSNIVGMVDYCEIDNGKLGCLFLEYCYNNLKKYLETSENDIEEGLVLKIINDVLKGLEALHLNGVAHGNVSLKSIVENQQGIFKLANLNHLFHKIYVSSTNKDEVKQQIYESTNELYRAPEELTLNVGEEIGPKVDIFALGVVLYLLCYRKFPFESKSNVLSSKFTIPETPKYSATVTSIINSCLSLNPKARLSAEQLLSKFVIRTRPKRFSISEDKKQDFELSQLDAKLCLLKSWNNSNRKFSEDFDLNVFSSIKKFFSQMTTETEGWITNFIENTETVPSGKYDRFIIAKCWQKRYKVEKVYQILDKEIAANAQKTFTNLKILILLHNFLRKGPKQAINTQMHPTPTSICQKINSNWNEKPQLKRNTFLALVIQSYSLILKEKVRIGYKYSMFMEGNYCLRPFFTKSSNEKILSITFLITLRNFLDRLTIFHEILLKENVSQDIQRSIILSIVDQQYCLFSLIVHLYSTFKHSTNFIEEEVDKTIIIGRINDYDKKLEGIFERLTQLLQKTSKFTSLLQNRRLFIDPQVMNYLINIPILEKKKNFNIRQHLNYENNIHGVRLPFPYQQVAKSSNFLKNIVVQEGSDSHLEMDGFKRKSQLVSTKFIFDTTTTTQGKKPEKKFDDFAFDAKTKDSKQKGKHSIVQFTHQHLNHDFMEENHNSKNQDHIKQFLSLGCESHLSNSVLVVASKSNDKNYSNLLQIEEEASSPRMFLKPSIIKPTSKLSSPPHNKQSPLLQDMIQPKPVISQILPSKISNSGIKLSNFVTEQVAKNANQYIIDFNQLKFMEQIGRGHSSDVFKGSWRGQQVAIKKIRLSDDNLIKQFKRELATTIKLRPHPNLVTLIGVSEKDDYFYIINQYCRGGNLFQLLHKSNVPLSFEIKISLAKQIAQGMLFLHTNHPSIVHRDLKSLNILLADEYRKQSEQLKVKIGDFGLSREISEMFMTGVLGTYHWMAPEIFNNAPYTIKADVYSYGIVLFEILARKTPYENITTIPTLINYVGIQNGRPDLSLISNKCPVELRMLMMKCWSMEPKDRPTFAEILEDLEAIKI